MFKGLEKFDTAAAADAGVWFQLEDPDALTPLEVDGVPVRVKMLGAEGKRWRKLQADLVYKIQQIRRQNRNRPNADLEHEATLEAYKGAILDWEGFFDDAGEAMPCSDEAKAQLLNLDWAFRQIDRFVVDRQGFLKGGSTS